MKKLLVVGGIGFSVAEILKQLEYKIEKPSNVFEIRMSRGCGYIDIPPNNEDGWYRKFDKISKKRNLKRG